MCFFLGIDMKDGLGFLGILTLVFIILKLTGVIEWSWFWVISPVLLEYTIIGAILIVTATRK